VGGGELEQAVEDEPAAARAAPLEAEHELVEVAGQMGVVDRALTGAEQPAFGERGDLVDAGEQLRRLRPRGARERLVGVEPVGRRPVGLPAVDDHPRAGPDVVDEERSQRASGGVGERRHTAPAEAVGFGPLDRHADQHLLALRAPASQPRLLATEVALIDLELAGRALPSGPHEHRAQPVEHRPRGLVGADLKLPL